LPSTHNRRSTINEKLIMKQAAKNKYRVSADIGGTFTDLVFQDAGTGNTFTGKILSTPQNPASAVLEGLKKFLPVNSAVDFMIHGTTVGLNAVLQRRGAKVAILTTKNFKDVYSIQGNDRRDIFKIHYQKPKTLVKPEDIYTINERLYSDGSVQTEINLEELKPLIAAVKEKGYEAIAVCLLFSYINPAHELAVKEYLSAQLPDFPIVLSHQVSPEWREFPRISTTVMDAFVSPVIQRYLSTLIDELETQLGSTQLHVMESNGGAMTAIAAREKPIQTLLSGPVGGTIGGGVVSRTLNLPNLICVDMGGTSFDASLIIDGKPTISSEAELEALPLQMSIIDIHVIGAGGGSIAWLEGGSIRVGPQSAGSDPGPACYQNGGMEPTVTDANIVLGRIDPKNFAGGSMTLDVEAARNAVETVAKPLGMKIEEMAQGIIDIVNAKMADAIRTITVKKGIDPRNFALFAYGGAGPMQAVALADQLEIKEVIVPLHPGTFSACGMLQTDVKHDFKKAYYKSWKEADPADIQSTFQDLEEQGRTYLRLESIPDEKISFIRTADFRYENQEYQISCELPDGLIDKDKMRKQFDQVYVAQYGHCNPDAQMEVVNLRLQAIGQLERLDLISPTQKSSSDTYFRSIYFGGKKHRTKIISRDGLGKGACVNGPSIIEEQTTTTILPPGWSLSVAKGGHLSIKRGEV
jgi:N-methylhydantoinase A